MKLDRGAALDGAADVRPAAAAAEGEGFDGFWLSEVRHDPFVGLTLAATVTERIELGTAIAVAFARNPMSTAVAANDLQALSGGRLLLGLGTQIKPHITRRFSMPWSHPAPRMREYVLALRAIWQSWQSGSKLDFRGEFYSHTLMTPMFTPERHPYGPPKVLIAGVGQAMTEVAGEVADGFLAHGFTTERYLREVTVPALRRGRDDAGRDDAGRDDAGRDDAGGALDDFIVQGSPFVVTGRTEQEMRAAADGVRGQIAFYGSTPAYRGVLEQYGWGQLGDELNNLSRQGRWAEMGPLIDDDVLGAFAVVGGPAEAGAEIVRRYGDVFDRITLYMPYEAPPEVSAEVSEAIRAAA